MNDEKPCPRCTNGRVRCPRCSGTGKPPLKGCTLWEKDAGRCRDCLGVATLCCRTCGGVQVVPA